LFAACANLASLFAARVTDRSREWAMRIALGSSAQRIARHIVTESLVICIVGAAAGIFAAHLLLELLNNWSPATESHLDARLDTNAYLFGFALAVGSALIVTLLSARQAWRRSPLDLMKGAPSAGAIRSRRLALRDWLLGLQVAICTLLVMSSLVAAQGLRRAFAIPLGFQPQGAVLVDLDLNQAQLDNNAAVARKKQILSSVENIPGVAAAGIVNRVPFTGGLRGTPIFRPGEKDFNRKLSSLSAYTFEVSPGYLRAAGTRLLRGRDFSWHDRADTAHVAIVNQAFARKLWSIRSALGQHFVVSGSLTEVIGIAEDGKYHDLQEPSYPAVYLSLAQSSSSDTILVVRSPIRQPKLAASIQGALAPLVPKAQFSIQDWADILQDQLFPSRVAAVALAILSSLAMLLAVTGIFAMASYSVSRRLKELGIRAALGANKLQVLRAALERPVFLLAFGSAAGILGALSATRLLAHIVYQARTADPLVIAGAALLMALIGIVASALPARRVLSVNPSRLMREE
jgi:predicted permease